MAELEFEAPLAKLEEAEDWGPAEVVKPGEQTITIAQTQQNHLPSQQLQQPDQEDVNLNNLKNCNQQEIDNSPNTLLKQCLCSVDTTNNADADNFTETFSGSLEDLVNTFDDKITRCFCNYDESVEKLAPVQVRSQEEIMNECQYVNRLKSYKKH
uniref:Uncharacterized protein n=1 Tax=Rhodnius prolixus TaxID=13249 RepID=T1HC77_RHOPR